MARQLIRRGYRGDDLAELVKLLHRCGCLRSPRVLARYGKALQDAVIYFQQTHLGRDGKPLLADGVVGAQTWWSLAHASGKPQRSGLSADKGPPGRIGDERDAILQIAAAEHARGVRERPMGSNRGKEIDRYLPGWTKKKGAKGPAWCCFFYSWVAKQALGSYPLGRRHGSCKRAVQAAKQRGLWVPLGAGTPCPGDAFVYLHAGGTGHIGFVYRVNRAGTEFNTIEGNCGNRVKLGVRSMASHDLAGFIRNVPEAPDFARGLVRAPRVGGAGTR